MPLINFSKDLLQEEKTVQDFDPRTLAWTYPHGLKKIGDMHFAIEASQSASHVTYGLFKSSKLLESDVISALEVELVTGESVGIPIKTVPIIDTVSTVKDERGKGHAKCLYEAVFNKHGAIISGDELYADAGKINRSLGMWLNTLSQKGILANINLETKKITPFNLESATGKKNIRFMIMKPELLVEGLRDTFKKAAIAGTALAALGMGGDSAHSAEKETVKPIPQEQTFKQEFTKTDISTDEILNTWLKQHEGVAYKVYKDKKQNPTIGVGFNLNTPFAKKIIPADVLEKLKSGEIELQDKHINWLLVQSIDQAVHDVKKLFTNFDSLPVEVQRVLVDLDFNMGIGGISQFKNFKKAIDAGNWSQAADELMYVDGVNKDENSKWWNDVTNNAHDFSTIAKKNPNNRAVHLISTLKNLKK